MKQRVIIIILAVFSLSFIPKKALLEKADEAYELKAYNLAIKYYEAFLKKESPCHEAATKLADSYWQTYKIKKAEDTYQSYLQCPAKNPIHYKKYAEVLITNGDYQKAIEQYKLYAAFDNEKEAVRLILNAEWASQQKENKAFKIDSLSQNSLAGDYGASFLNDQIVFSSSRIHSEKVVNHPCADNLLYHFETPKQIKPYGYEIAKAYQGNNTANIGPIQFSSDGQLAVFNLNDFVEGSRPLLGNFDPLELLFAEVDSVGTLLEIQSFDFNIEGYSTTFPSFTSGGDTLIFASNRPDGFGGFDLYYALKKEDGQWSEAKNMGPEINSAGNEITPNLKNGQLYFSSDYQKGFGGFDVFRAAVDEDGFFQISQMGKGVNSRADDYGFNWHPSGDYALLGSNRGGSKSGEDIFLIQTLEQVQSISNSTKEVVFQVALTHPNSFLLSDNQRISINTSIPTISTIELKTISLNLETPILKIASTPRKVQFVASLPNRFEKPVITKAVKTFDGKSPYRIRVKTVKIGEAFDESQILDLGKYRAKDWKKFTIHFLEGYQTKEEANEALIEVQAMGFPKATLVKLLENGQLKSTY